MDPTREKRVWFIYNMDTKYSPNFLTKLSGLQLDGFESGWIWGFWELSFNMSWKYRRIATPSPHECSKFSAAYPSLVISNENDLSNHLEKQIFWYHCLSQPATNEHCFQYLSFSVLKALFCNQILTHKNKLHINGRKLKTY